MYIRTMIIICYILRFSMQIDTGQSNTVDKRLDFIQAKKLDHKNKKCFTFVFTAST